MGIEGLVALALVAAAMLVVLRQQRPEMALLLSLAAGTLLLTLALREMAPSLVALADLASRAGAEGYYLDTVLRVIGIAYLADFGAQVCEDSGERSLARKVELAGKALIMVLAIPLVGAVLEVVLRLLP